MERGEDAAVATYAELVTDLEEEAEGISEAENKHEDALKASICTGIAYILTVAVRIAPYLILQNYFVCRGLALAGAVVIIALFNYYVSVAKDLPFRRRFTEMTCLGLGVATASFGIGFVVRHLLGVEL